MAVSCEMWQEWSNLRESRWKQMTLTAARTEYMPGLRIFSVELALLGVGLQLSVGLGRKVPNA